MKSTIVNCPEFESTYALIVRSEERRLTLLETVSYTLLIASTIFAFSQLGQHPFTVPVASPHATVHLAQAERSA